MTETQSSKSETPNAPPTSSGRRRWITWTIVLIVLLVGIGLMLAEVGLWRGRVAIEERRHDDAARWLQLAGTTWPRGGEWHFLSAVLARRQMQFEDVEQHLRQAHQLDWPLDELEFQQLLTHAQTGQFDKVGHQWAELFRNAGSDGPEICHAYVKYSLARFRLAEAATVIDTWKADFPEDAGPWLVEGTLNSVLLRWSVAEEKYRQALELDPGLVEARRKLATALIRQLKFAEAEEQLQIVSQHLPTPEVYADLAHCRAQQSRPEEALRLLELALQEHPKHVRLLAEFGELKLMQNENEAAVAALQQVIDSEPENTELRYSLAQALRNTGQEDAAQQHFAMVDEGTKALLKLSSKTAQVVADPQDVETRFDVAETVWRWKSRTDGAAWLHSVLEFDPDHRATHQLLAEHYQRAGQEQKAAYHRAKSEANAS